MDAAHSGVSAYSVIPVDLFSFHLECNFFFLSGVGRYKSSIVTDSMP